MSRPDHLAMVDRGHAAVSVRRQCALLGVARAGVYRPVPAPGPEDLALMRRLDALYLEAPFYGSRRMAEALRRDGVRVGPSSGAPADASDGPGGVGAEAGDQPAGAGPSDLSLPVARAERRAAEPGVGGRHHLHPDGPRLSLSRSDHRRFSRAVLAWRLSNTMDAVFCVEALEVALAG